MVNLTKVFHSARDFIVQTYQNVFKENYDEAEYSDNNENYDESEQVGYFQLFRFATPFDWFLMFLGVIFTALKALSSTLQTVICGEYLTLLIDRTLRNTTVSKSTKSDEELDTTLLRMFGGGRLTYNATDEENHSALMEDAVSVGKFLFTLSMLQFLFSIFCVDLFNHTALKQVSRIRVKFLNSLIRQEVGWFDCATSDSNFAVRVLEDIERIRDAISEKVSHFLDLLFSFTFSIAISFYYGWKLTLVIITYVPILFVSNYIVIKFQAYFSANESNGYAIASSVSEDVLGGIRTVVAFGGEEKEAQRYKKLLSKPERAAILGGATAGVGEGIAGFVLFISNAVAYWYGFSLVLADKDNTEKEYTPTVLMIVFTMSCAGGEQLYSMEPFLQSFAIARGVAATIFKIIDRKSNIDPMSKDGIIKSDLKGDIEFKDVEFSYPSRTETKILNDFSGKFINGQTVALVGSSGNGKSTCLQLLQRFYDPTAGRILIDGHDIKDLNLSWLRSNMAFVGQEPALFATTIEENIRYGKPDASKEQIVESAKKAGAHDFIVELQKGYETLVGERGCQLSGGQKQRIAIARALINNPKILLLDEATAALDSHSEKLVQQALNEEPALFATTIEENIRYGKPDASKEQIVESAKKAGAHDFIVELQKGYETLVGERGCQLSGGQKQRIAIARALINNPKILLLDEATAALDSHSEKLVQQALNEASKGRTTIVVSHRLSAIRNADRILFIKKGKIIEAGSHDELLALQGCYYDMMTSPNTVIENVNSFSDNDYENDDELDEKHQLADSQQLQGSKESPTDDIEEKEPLELWPVSKRILTSSKSGYSIFLLAILLSVLVSVCSVGHSLLFAEFFTAIARDDSDEAREVVAYICIALAALGIIDGVLAYYRIYFFTKTGVLMTSKIQGKAFAAMLSQDMAWFDEPKNAVGALSVRLTGDAGTLRGAIGYPICEITNLVFRFVSGSVISFIYSWKLALVTLPIGIFVMLSVYLEKVWSERTEQAEKQGFEEITKVATESILNIRTVASLRQEPHVIARYCAEENKVKKIIRQRLSIRGLSFSFGETIPYLGYTLLLYCGGVLVANEGVDSKSMIIVTEAMLEGTLTLGEILVFVPSIILALFAAHRLFKVTDRKPQIKSPEIFNVSRKSDKSNNVLFNQICFNYPTRPNVNVLQNINLDAPEGKTVALVGPSGCGKSTCIQLLQRLYDPENGRIFVGLDEISRDITLKDLRSKLSIVSQEPVLFDRTIAENIEYGDNSRVVDMTQIIEAAKMANIHDFITSLPMGYDTRLGMRQTQLSGGQKQRVAIARALVRNPKVLLMDEATSALDAANEKAVQDALDLARTGRTCIVIAHRLSTIKNSDLIYVIQNGSICEQGSHHQLMELGGLYSKLYSMQTKVEKVN